MISNQELADVFSEFGEILELKGADRFKIIAYERAAQAIRSHGELIEEILSRGGKKELQEIPGVGEAISSKIEEYIKTGRVKELENLKKNFPPAELEFMKIPGIGPKTALKLYRDLKAKNISDLKEKLQKSGSEFFKEKTLENLIHGIELYGKRGSRLLLSMARPIAEDLEKYLISSKLTKKAIAVGSLRRWKETVGDIDIIASSSEPEAVIDYFSKYRDADEVIAKGKTKCSIIHRLGMQIDLEILPQESFGSLLQHFTGSREHNIALRTFAQEHKMSVSEHGIKTAKSGKLIKCETEELVYKTLGMDYIPPELREDRGEIEAALRHILPNLVGEKEILGDLHVHSSWSDGRAKIEQLVERARELKYDYIAISDHTVGLGVAGGLSSERFESRRKEIATAQKKYPEVKILNSCEVNIKVDGSLDMPDVAMEKFDVVTASIHSGFNQSEEKITQRMLAAISNKYVDVIGHPSGRIINRREPYAVNWRKVFENCREENVALEINSSPDRLDLSDALIFEARKYGVKFVITTDSHDINQMDYILYGLKQAQRGWCEKKDILNTMNYKDLMSWLERN